jgi:hypothetical protein
MSIAGLFNKRCTWTRRVNKTTDDYGEIIYSDVVIGSDVLCARQTGHGLNMRQEVSNKPPGIHSFSIVKYYLLPTDIRAGDLMTYQGSETEIVRNVRDAAGRGSHYEILTEDVRPFGERDQRLG